MILEIPMRPFPAVRVNGRFGRFTPKAKEYHNKMNELRKHLLPHIQEIMDSLVYGDYTIQFHFAMPKSWSDKKKNAMDGKPHDSTPDIDNIFKSFSDTVFYGEGTRDKEIWHLSASKHWSREDKIIFITD